MNFFNIEINSTSSCNLRCTYCFEHEYFNKNLKPDELFIETFKEKIDFLLINKKFLEKFDGITICFWGGEPTLNCNLIFDLVDYYKNIDNIQFLIYSNGFHFSKDYIMFLEKYKDKKIINNEPKIIQQISYDGLASHDITRLDIKGKGSALKVKETIFKVAQLKIPFVIQQTITFENIELLYDNYMEFKKLNDLFSVDKNFRGIHYNPTLDYITDHKFSNEEVKIYLEKFKKALMKIAKVEIENIDNFRKNKQFFFGWLNKSLAICGAGAGIVSFSFNGKGYACHAGIYEEENTFETNDLYLDNELFLNNLLENSFKYNNIRSNLPLECSECHAHYCKKCNIIKHKNSLKDTFFEKWVDYNNQEHLCIFYKFLGSFRISLLKYIREV